MWAAFIDRCGPADELRYDTLPLPRCGPTDVLVRVEAVAVDAVDTFVRSGAYPTELSFPFVVGRDLVGRVVDQGPGAVGFRKGDLVWTNSLGHGGRQGAAAQYAVVATDRLYRVPAGVDPVAMAAIVHPAATADLALRRNARLRAGETVLVLGAAGHVGSAATVLAHLAGGRVIAVARAEDLDTCLGLGADVAVDYRDHELVHRLRAAAPAGVDVHLDTSGHHDLDTAVGLLAQGGRIVLMAGLAGRPELPVGAFYTRDAQVTGFAISNASVPDLAIAARRVNQLMAASAWRLPRVEELPLSAAAEAHRRLERGESAGVRLVLRPPGG